MSRTISRSPWRKRSNYVIDTNFCGPPFPPPPDPVLTPYQYFKQLFDDNLIDIIVENTNLYSMQETGTSINVSNDDIEIFLGILITMGGIKLPTQRMYWSKSTRIPSIADVM